MKKLIYVIAFCLTTAVFSQSLLNSSYALEFNAPGVPSAATLTGADNGNVSSVVTKIDLTNFYSNAVISSAQFSLKQTTVLEAGTVKIYDNYTYITSPTSALIGEFDARQENTFSFNNLDFVRNWISNSNTNQGLLIKASGIDADASLVLSLFNLKLDFTLPDKVGPVFTIEPTAQKISNKKYRIIAQTDEPVTAVLDFGKTSNYGEVMYMNSLSKDVQFDIDSVQEGVTYHYRITASDAAGNKTISKNYTFDIANAVTELKLDEDITISINTLKISELNAQLTESSGNYAVKLTWSSENNNNIKGFKIFRKDSVSNEYDELTRINNDISTYLDLQIILGQELQYKIVAFNDNSESLPSESLKVIIPDTPASSQSGENGNVTVFFVLGIALTAFSIYLVFKFAGKTKSLFQQKNKKTQLNNYFRDPDLVN